MRALVVGFAAVIGIAAVAGAAADNNTLSGKAEAPATPVAACTDPPPERKGQIVTEGSLSLQPIMAFAALLETASLEVTANASAWWCSEREITSGSLTLQIWRTTRAAGGVTSVQRIMVRDHPVTMYVVFSTLASAPLNKDRHTERLTWRAHVLYGPYEGGWAVFRVFDGEPAPELIAPLIADIVAGKLRPLAHVDSGGVTHIDKR